MSIRNGTARRRIGIVLALALAASSAGPAAWGQTPEATKEAEARFKEGLKRHDAGDEEGARLSFLQAFSVLKRPNILFNLARAEQLTNHPVDAIGHYKLFVADNTVTGVDRETARKRIVELSAIVGHVLIDAPSGADLWIDGQMLPRKAPLGEPADVAGGMHTVQARLGEQTKTATVTCNPGQTVTAKIEIEITGTPVVVVPMPGEGGTAPVVPPVQEKPFHYETPTAKVVTVIVLGVGAVGLLAAGIGLEAASSSANNALTADHELIQKMGGNPNTFCTTSPNASPCADEASKASAHAGDANAGVGMFVGTGVLAAAAVVTWVVWPKTKVQDGARIFPIVSPQMAGLGLTGSF
jgi:hypothetical protein